MSDKSLTADRKERSVRFARDAVQARTDYDADSKAVDELTARLRRERLAREAAEKRGAKNTTKKATKSPRPRKQRTKAAQVVADASAEPVLELSAPHLYGIDERVVIAVKGAGTIGATGVYRIVRQLPAEGGDNRYRIKGETEAYERVVAESRLKAAG